MNASALLFLFLRQAVPASDSPAVKGGGLKVSPRVGAEELEMKRPRKKNLRYEESNIG